VEREALAPVTVSGVKTASSDTSTEELIVHLDAGEGTLRAAATSELFRRGRRVLAVFEQQGARPMETITPPRRDVVMTLIAGLDKSVQAPFRRNSFGLHLDPNVTRDQVVQMGRRHGFRLPDGAALRADAAPSVYVELSGDARLENVLQAVLSSEPSVRTVNLNYTERG
jgi:hypothetical protein